jgi:1,4-dihydroxy-2-naphthoate octaprenyltransferase
MGESKYLFGLMRIPFLILTPACVVLGLGAAVWTAGRVSALHFALVLIGAISAHISVNVLNEYFDFKSGLDAHTERTPFSGGSGTLQERPGLAKQALGTGLVSLGITALIGLYFLNLRGLLLLPLGLLGMLVILVYTIWLTRNPLVCLIAPGVGFGPLMVMGTSFPDVEADQRVGRRHFPIAVGRQTSSLVYGAFLLLAYVTITLGVAFAYLPKFSLAGLLTLVIAVPVAVGAYRYANEIKRLTPLLGANVVINILTPLLVAIGLFVG